MLDGRGGAQRVEWRGAEVGLRRQLDAGVREGLDYLRIACPIRRQQGALAAAVDGLRVRATVEQQLHDFRVPGAAERGEQRCHACRTDRVDRGALLEQQPDLRRIPRGHHQSCHTVLVGRVHASRRILENQIHGPRRANRGRPKQWSHTAILRFAQSLFALAERPDAIEPVLANGFDEGVGAEHRARYEQWYEQSGHHFLLSAI